MARPGMLRSLIAFVVYRRLVALAATAAVAAYGVFAYLNTAIEAYPDVTNVQVGIIAQAPGLAPEEVERQITLPLERVLNGTPCPLGGHPAAAPGRPARRRGAGDGARLHAAGQDLLLPAQQ
jgi:hypothetical protein